VPDGFNQVQVQVGLEPAYRYVGDILGNCRGQRRGMQDGYESVRREPCSQRLQDDNPWSKLLFELSWCGLPDLGGEAVRMSDQDILIRVPNGNGFNRNHSTRVKLEAGARHKCMRRFAERRVQPLRATDIEIADTLTTGVGRHDWFGLR